MITKIIGFFIFFVALSAFAQSEPSDEGDPLDDPLNDSSPVASSGGYLSSFENKYPTEPGRARNGWMPVVSFILPGFDQIIQGQYGAGFTYAGYGLFGLSLSSSVRDKATTPGQADISSRNNVKRQILLGDQMYEMAGAMSAFQSYHSIIDVYRKSGTGYTFITNDDTSLDLILAPLHFQFLTKVTTWLPLAGLLAGVLAVQHNPMAANYLDATDAGYLSAFSVQAGVAEESLLRGAFMPSLRQWWGSDFWSNTTQATAFAALHISSQNPVPLPQLALGWYLGWLTQRNGYSIRESIFIHAWWDVIAFTATYLDQSNYDRATNIYMPVVDARF